MKRILLIATGGTIASRPTAAGGLAPALTSAELLACVPELAEVCHIDALQLYNLDSTNIGPDQWIGMVHAVRDHYDAYDGFVITHGTDTMAYTAAALAYMIQRSAKPVVLTGSQKSIYNRDTDARNNLYRAVLYACHPAAWGVQLVFDGKVILGTRARKIRTKSFNAFSSIDYPDTAEFRDLRLVPFLPMPAGYGPVQFQDRLDPAVFVLRLVPGMRADIIPLLAGHCNALILESFGVGGLPGGDDGPLFAAVRDWCAAGRLAVFTTQVPHEGSDLAVYEVGRAAKALPGVLEAQDMTPEAAAVKLMWALGQAADRDEAARLFLTPVQFDLA
ncbi:MAG TPA: asparaginase [Candidatus Gemmiger stercoravium]|nr:asparaginase [Candidatus Gemmiger stercoravium]